MKVEFSYSGLPCLWETGGGFTNTGNSIIIAGTDGEKVNPIYIRSRGSLACGQHALIPVRAGMYVIESDHHRGDFHIEVFRISSIEGDQALLEEVTVFKDGQWLQPLPPHLESAVDAAISKAETYHCRTPVFVK